MIKKTLVFVAALTLVVFVACSKKEETTNIDTGTDTAVTAGETSVTTETTMSTDTMSTDTMATDTMSTDTSATGGTTTSATSGTSSTSTTSTTTHT